MLAATRGGFQGDDYDQEGCVALNGYEELPWRELVEFWQASNSMMALAVSRIWAERLGAPCTIGTHEPLALSALIESYIAHMQHHLDHILKDVPSPVGA